MAAVPHGGGQRPGPHDRYVRGPAAHPPAGRLPVALRARHRSPLQRPRQRNLPLSSSVREGAVDRRRFLGRTMASVAWLAAGGTALRGGQLGRAAQERNGSALPDGPSSDLGRRQLIWSVPTAQPLAALTFDDGPDPELTPSILAVLARYGVRPRFFRPPRGELTGAALQAAARLGHDILLWSVTRGPAGVGTPQAVADHLAAAVGPGDVVGLHDGIGRATFDRGGVHAYFLRARRRVEVAALPAAIEGMQARNLRLVTASALLDAAASAPATWDR